MAIRFLPLGQVGHLKNQNLIGQYFKIMSNEIKQYRVNDDGMTCRHRYPHEKYNGDNNYLKKFWDGVEEGWYNTVINYPLTVEQKPGSIVDGQIVWQYEVDYDAVNSEWLNIDFPPEVAIDIVLSDYGYDNKRQAVEPVTPSKETIFFNGIEVPADFIDPFEFTMEPSKEVKEDEQDIATCLEAFIDSCYKGCSKDELNQLRINAEKALKNYKR